MAVSPKAKANAYSKLKERKRPKSETLKAFAAKYLGEPPLARL